MTPSSLTTERGSERRVRHPVIGFWVDRLDDSYQDKLLTALISASEDAGGSLVCFCAGPAYNGAQGHERHHALHLASPTTLDALLVSTPTLVSAVGQAELMRQLARFKGVPVVSMGSELPGVASIVLDNNEAMQRIVRHLLQDHACRRIAFIRGPTTNAEAQARYQGYVAALDEAGIKPDPQLLVHGDFHQESGARAARTLLDRRIGFDAMVVSNDDMAVAAIHELQERGVRIPADVKVTGFDDDVQAQYELPSLTTMRQRVTRLAVEAVKLAVTGFEIDISERRHLLRTELILRRSCGCPLEREQFSVSPPKRPEHGEHEPPLIQKRPVLLKQMLAAAPNLLQRQHAEQLLDGFIAGLMNKSMTAFVESWDDMLREAILRNDDLKRYQAVTTALRRGAVPALMQLPGIWLRAETMLHEARVLLANVIHQKATQQQLQEKRLAGKLCGVGQSLIGVGDILQLTDTLAQRLEDLNVPSCCLAVYDPRHVPDSKNRVRIVLWYRDGIVVPLDTGNQFYYESDLVSDSFLRLRHSVMLPLCFGDKKLGIAAFEVGIRDGTVYETLRAQTSAALEAVFHGNASSSAERERELLIERAQLQFIHVRAALACSAREADTPQSGSASAEELESRMALLEQAINALLDTREQPNTLRAPSAEYSAESSGIGRGSIPREAGS